MLKLGRMTFDSLSFCKQNAKLQQTTPLNAFERLRLESVNPAENRVEWALQGSEVAAVGGEDQQLMHLTATVQLSTTCHRCLRPLIQLIAVDNAFQLAKDEDTAAQMDEELEQDVLVHDAQFDALALVEDELLMAMPTAMTHPDDDQTCVAPQPVTENPNLNPFAALASLRQAT